MRTRGAIAVAASWAASCASLWLAVAHPAAAAGHGADRVVVIEAIHLSPGQLVVRRGERITFVNKDLVPHKATAEARAFDSGTLAAGASWTWVAGHTGVTDYGCLFHPTMHGRLEVRP